MEKPSNKPVLVSAVVAALVIMGAAIVLKHWVVAPVPRVVVALMPIPAYAVFAAVMIGYVRRLDGLQQRISLEAMTFAATATGLAALLYGQLETAGVAPPLNAGLVAPALLLLYAVGYGLSARRYQ
jgi:hypothetical protein